ncbi:ATP-binding protein [Streptomyces sp. NPDC059897]|uniref:ATP-binding protein n=1 Tax=Streptomyces sp. NPDC059897 TaxID=3346994 RepID=UPI0036497249
MASSTEDDSENSNENLDGNELGDTQHELDQPPGQHIWVGGDSSAPVIAGNHIAYIGAENGSTVIVRLEGERPRPRRRERVGLPPRRQNEPFGRSADLAAIRTALSEGKTVQLWGPAGTGKSALLRYAALELDAGPDGILFLDASGREPEDLGQDIFEACHETHGYAPPRAVLRDFMQGMKVTVYVDNADYDAEQLSTVMDAAPHATFVFAGRENSLLGPDVRSQQVQGIDRTAAVRLLESALARPLDAAGGQDAAEALWEATSGMPLPLLRAAAAARLDPSGRTELPKPGAVRELLPLLFGRLDGPALRALHLLATFGDAALAPAHIGALSGIPDPEALCEKLVRLGLAQQSGPGFRTTSDVVRALKQREGLVPYSLERLCGYFAEWAARPATEASQVAAHSRVFEVIVEIAERSGRADLAVRVVRATSPTLARSLRFGIWGRLLDQGLPAARRGGDRRAEAYFTHERGIRSILTGNRVLAATLLAQAVTLWRLLGDDDAADTAVEMAQAHAGNTAPAPDTQTSTEGSSPADTPSQGDASPPADGGSPPSEPDATPGPDAGSTGANPPPAEHANPAGPDAPPLQEVSDAPAWNTAPVQDTGSVPQDPTPPSDTGSAVQDPTFSQSVPEHGLPVDPGTASTAPGTLPPGLGEGATAAGTGTAHAGTAVALKVAAVIASVAIGTVAVQQTWDSTSPGPDSPAATVTMPGTGIDDENLADAASATPEPEPTGLAGRWLHSEGGGLEFVDAGSGSYTVRGQDICGDTTTVEFTGSGDTYTSTGPLYDTDDGSCGDVIGEVTTTITVAPDADTAKATRVMTSAVSDGVTCYDCTPFTLTRL